MHSGPFSRPLDSLQEHKRTTLQVNVYPDWENDPIILRNNPKCFRHLREYFHFYVCVKCPVERGTAKNCLFGSDTFRPNMELNNRLLFGDQNDNTHVDNILLTSPYQ